MAERFPAFVSLRIARDDRVWVRDFVRPTEPVVNRWLVFADDGSFVCKATLPEGAEVLEFGADYVLTLIRDDADVERVHKYSVGAAASNTE